DTGSAIVGPARADIYFGAGPEAGNMAGRIKNPARFVMLIPRALDPVAAGQNVRLPPERRGLFAHLGVGSMIDPTAEAVPLPVPRPATAPAAVRPAPAPKAKAAAKIWGGRWAAGGSWRTKTALGGPGSHAPPHRFIPRAAPRKFPNRLKPARLARNVLQKLRRRHRLARVRLRRTKPDREKIPHRSRSS